MDGILLIDKPKDWTSFDVVNKIRHTVQAAGMNHTGRKRFPVGHTGTLDPLATGLMVVVLGNYTKRAQEYSKLDKIYEVTMCLGQTSTTGDEEGEKTVVSDKKPGAPQITEAIKSFEGEIEQIPPAFSAIKVNGQRAYKLAREGKEAKIDPRKVTIYQTKDIKYTYPGIKFTVSVSSGTYIRTLVEDIGTKLGTGAYMTDLNRTDVGDYNIKYAIKIHNIGIDGIQKSLM